MPLLAADCAPLLDFTRSSRLLLLSLEYALGRPNYCVAVWPAYCAIWLLPLTRWVHTFCWRLVGWVYSFIGLRLRIHDCRKVWVAPRDNAKDSCSVVFLCQQRLNDIVNAIRLDLEFKLLDVALVSGFTGLTSGCLHSGFE